MDHTSRTTRALRRAALVALVAAHVVSGAPPATAKVVEGFTVNDRNQKGAGKSFDPIPGEDPYYPLAAGQYNFDNCKAGVDPANTGKPDYMVTVRMVMNLSVQNGHRTTFSLTWPDIEVGLNNLDFFMFDAEGRQMAQSAGGSEGEPSPPHPEKIEIVDLQNGVYYLCAANRDGPNEGFTIRSEVRYEFTGVDRPTPTPTATPSPTPTPRRTPKPTPRPTVAAVSEPTPTPEIVATPGPDGPDSRSGLPLVAAGRQGSPLEEGSTTRTVFGILTVLIALGGAGFVVYRIRKDRV